MNEKISIFNQKDADDLINEMENFETEKLINTHMTVRNRGDLGSGITLHQLLAVKLFLDPFELGVFS